LFLLVVFNGHAWFEQFDLLNVKTIVLFLFILFIERELKARKSILTINYKFLSLQLCILSIILSILPYFIFIVPIYLVHDTNIRDIFKMVQIKKYLLFALIFVGLNFFFIIYPYLFVDFLNGLNFPRSFPVDIYSLTPEFIINNDMSTPTNFLIGLISILKIDISASLITVVLSSLFTLLLVIRYKDMLIERKLAFFCLFSLLFNSYLRTNTHVTILPIIILLFSDQEKITLLKSYNIFLFIKKNIILVLGMMIISILLFLPDLEYIYRMFKILRYIPVQLMIFTWPLLYCCLWMMVHLFNKKELDRKEIINYTDRISNL